MILFPSILFVYTVNLLSLIVNKGFQCIFEYQIYKMNILSLEIMILFYLHHIAYSDNGCFYAQMFTLFDGERNIKNWRNPGYSFGVSWRQQQLNIVQHSYVLAGFEMQSRDKLLSYTASLTSVTSNGATFDYNPTLNLSEIVAFQFSVILIKSCGETIYLGLLDLPLSILNLPARTDNYQDFNSIPFGSPVVSNGFILSSIMISSCSLSSLSNLYLKVQVMSSTNLVFDIRVSSNASYGNIFTQVKATYLFFPTQLQKHDYVYVLWSYTSSSVQTNAPSSLNPNPSKKCLFGLYMVHNSDTTIGRPYLIITRNDETYPKLYKMLVNPLNVQSNNHVICLGKCLYTLFPKYSISSYSCASCTQLKANCLTCNSLGICVTCLNGYYLQITYTNHTCISCSSECLNCQNTDSCQVCAERRPVIGGCTDDNGCIEVDNRLPYTAPRCLMCNQTGNFMLVNGTCQCLTNYYQVSGLCTDTKGCTTAVYKDDQIICSICNLDLNFQFEAFDGKCKCKEGYEDKIMYCGQRCGDGVRDGHDCDDGNMVEGDGCSAECQVQKDFDCYGNRTDPSSCIYLRFNIALEIVSIKKVMLKNQGIFKLRITPKLVIYHLLNQTSIFFHTNQSHSVVSITLNYDIIQIVVDYTQDLQSFSAQVLMKLGQPLFLQEYSNINFKMVSNNSGLIVIRKQERLNLFVMILEGISWIILAVFSLSIFINKMIGIQLVQSMQIIYYVHLKHSKYTSFFSVFGFLSNSSFNFLFKYNFSSDVYSYFQNVQFSQENHRLSQFIIYGSLLPILIVSIIETYLRTKQAEQTERVSNLLRKNENIKSISIFIYNKIVFPITISLSYLVFFIITSLNITNEQTKAVSGYAAIIIIIAFSIINFLQIKDIFTNDVNTNSKLSGIKKCNKRYIGIYLIFQFIISIILSSMYALLGQIGLYYLASISLLFFIILFTYRPYKMIVHNIGILLNLSASVSFIIWCILRNHDEDLLEEDNQIFAIFIILVFITISVIFSLARVIIQYKNWYLKNFGKERQVIAYDKMRQTEQEKKKPIKLDDLQDINNRYQKSYLLKGHQQYNINEQKQIPSLFFKKNSTSSNELIKYMLAKKQYGKKIIKRYQQMQA